MATRFERPNSMTFASQASGGAFWNKLLTNLEGVLADIQTQVTDIAAINADLAAKQATLDAHQAELTAQLAQIIAAQDAADEAHRNDSISSSWTSPGAILSAADAGTSATITVANHTRKYGDATQHAVTGGSLTGLAYSTAYYVYYDDTSRADAAPSFIATTNPNNALPNAAAGRHFCGNITTPASGAGSTSGGVSPPGSGGSISGGQIP